MTKKLHDSKNRAKPKIKDDLKNISIIEDVNPKATNGVNSIPRPFKA
jgi:hypothetical protein